MIDIHTHVLPGVDDGSPSADVTLPILQRFADEGVEIVVCTPHLEASRAARAPHEEYETIFLNLLARAPRGLTPLRGWEIMIDAPGIDLRDRRLGLGGSIAVLVEFPRMQVPAAADGELVRLRASGVIPLLAHPERYWGCTPRGPQVARRGGGDPDGCRHATGRTNCVQTRSRPSRAGARRLHLERQPRDQRSLAPAREWLLELSAPEQAALLTRTNPQRLLEGQPPLPVAPLLIPDPGMFARLKQLVLGR